jgi:hypothetical protein
MAYENIRFHQPHLVALNGYFYLLDYTQKLLSQKASNGATSFQYPININNTFTAYTVDGVICLQYDGSSFWSLQKFSNGAGLLIRKWSIESYLCNLVTQFPLLNVTGVIKYDANTISVESYITTLLYNVEDGDNHLVLTEYTEFAIFPGTILHVGFNKDLKREYVVVDSVDNQTIYLKSSLVNNYLSGDTVTITSSIFIFNNYVNYTANKGSLITLDPSTGQILSRHDDIEYLNISASKFYRLTNVLHNNPNVFTLAYTKDTNLKLRDVSDLYRYRATIRATDTFSGGDLTFPDDTRWVVSYGNPTIYNNKLLFSTVGGGHDEVTSKYLLLNDFEVQVSGTLWGVTTYTGIDVKYYNHYLGLNFVSTKTNVKLGLRYTTDYSNNVDTDGLVLYYKFDNSFIDYSGNNFVTNSGIAPTFTTGINTTVSGAAFFGTTNTSINVSNTSLLDVGKNDSDFSIIFWLKLNAPYDTVNHTIIQKGTTTTQRTPCVWALANSNTLFFGLTTTINSTQGISVPNTTIGSWIHVAYTKINDTIYVYYDKVLKGSLLLSGTSIGNTSPFYFGENILYTSKLFSIDNFRMFNRALTYYEIKDYFEAESNFFTALNGSTIFCGTINNSLIQYNTLVSGIENLSYKMKAIRSGDNLQLSYLTITSGIENSNWVNLSPLTIPAQECSISLGLHSALVTVSGTYFEDLTFMSGYLRYPKITSTYYGIMTMDNIKNNQSTVIPIYDIDIDGDNLYRLQRDATYYGTDNTWSTYNYQISPIRSFVDFITVDSSTHILPATGRNTATIYSVTLDQYGQGVFNRPVTFTDDDPKGFITTKTVYTDVFYNTGRADTGYTSGTALRVVKIDAAVTQLD